MTITACQEYEERIFESCWLFISSLQHLSWTYPVLFIKDFFKHPVPIKADYDSGIIFSHHTRKMNVGFNFKLRKNILITILKFNNFMRPAVCRECYDWVRFHRVCFQNSSSLGVMFVSLSSWRLVHVIARTFLWF